MSTNKQHDAFYAVINAKTPAVNAWFVREEAKLAKAEAALKAKRATLEDARKAKLAAIEQMAHSAMRRVRD